jgi:ribose transport system permease protein
MKKMAQYAANNKPLILLAALVALMGSAFPYFLSVENLNNILTQSAIYGIMACGMTFAIIGGDFDLSIGSTMALSGLIAILTVPWLGQTGAILLALAVSALIGLLNGILVAKFTISSFIATIGMSSVVKGIALRISDGNPIASQNAAFSQLGNGALLGIRYPVIVMALLVLVTSYVLRSTRYGRNVYTIGGNLEVASNSGVNTVFSKASIFVLSALSAGVAGVLNASRLNTGSAVQGDSMALNVITGVVIGGTSLIGGVGGIGKSIIGIFIFSAINNALDVLGVYSYYQMAIRGLLLVVIIGMEAIARHHSEQS